MNHWAGCKVEAAGEGQKGGFRQWSWMGANRGTQTLLLMGLGGVQRQPSAIVPGRDGP